MAFKIKVATKGIPIKTNIGTLHVSSVKSHVDVTEHNKHLLGFLDALKDVKRMPDCSVFTSSKTHELFNKRLKANRENRTHSICLGISSSGIAWSYFRKSGCKHKVG
jgi:hypothetical protein